MPLIGFTVFREKIESGEKRQTIRLKRKKPVKKGDILYLYWKLRTKECRRIRPAFLKESEEVICSESFPMKWRDMENDELAKRDGFKTLEEFRNWFRARYQPTPDTEFDVIRW